MGTISSKGRKKAIIFEHDPTTVNSVDRAVEVEAAEVGASNMTVHNEELKRVIEEGRKEIKEAQEKLNSSLTTPIVDSEAKVMRYFKILSTQLSYIAVVFRSLKMAIGSVKSKT